VKSPLIPFALVLGFALALFWFRFVSVE
jgi:hypothetical protein